jgi:hypothetical protein
VEGRRRSVVLLVFGILNLVFGGAGLLALLAGGLMMIGAASASEGGIIAWFLVVVSSGLDFVAIGLLLAAGVGLLMMRSWARWLSLAYAPVGVLARLLALVFWLSRAVSGFKASEDRVLAIIFAVLNVVFLLYPVVEGIAMLLPSTVTALRAAPRR